MGKIVITTNISVDGVVQNPDGQEGSGLGGWFGQFGGKDLEAWTKVATDETLEPRRCFLADEVMSGSPRVGSPGAASGRRVERHAEVRWSCSGPIRRLETSEKKPLQLVGMTAIGDSLILVTYQVVRNA